MNRLVEGNAIGKAMREKFAPGACAAIMAALAVLWQAQATRPLTKADEGAVGVDLIELIYLPHRKPRVLAGARWVKADIGRVGSRYADIWVRREVDDAPKGVSRSCPNLFRARLDSGRIWILDSFKKEAQK